MGANTKRNLEKTAREILPLLSPGNIMCVFDTETTGLPRKGKVVHIIQFSAIRYRVLPGYQFEEIDFCDRYINPEEMLAPKITELTGITDRMLDASPNEEIVGPVILRYLDSADVWAAYNARFDLGMVSSMAERIGYYFEEKPCIDVLELSRDWVRKGIDANDNKLSSTYGYLYPDGVIQFHNSLADVQATVAVMEALVPKYQLNAEASDKNIHVSNVYAWVNPYRPSQQRIRITLDAPYPVKDGDIYYDCVLKAWCHATRPEAKKAFESFNAADFDEIERQVLDKFYYRGYRNMDQLAKDRISFLLKKRKEKEKELKGQQSMPITHS